MSNALEHGFLGFKKKWLYANHNPSFVPCSTSCFPSAAFATHSSIGSRIYFFTPPHKLQTRFTKPFYAKKHDKNWLYVYVKFYQKCMQGHLQKHVRWYLELELCYACVRFSLSHKAKRAEEHKGINLGGRGSKILRYFGVKTSRKILRRHSKLFVRERMLLPFVAPIL